MKHVREKDNKIRRNTSEYLLLKGGVIETKLTESELEQIFQMRSEQYQMENIEDTLQLHMSQESL